MISSTNLSKMTTAEEGKPFGGPDGMQRLNFIREGCTAHQNVHYSTSILIQLHIVTDRILRYG